MTVVELMAVCILAVLTVSTTVLPTFYAVGGREYPEALPLLEMAAWVSALWTWLYAYASRHRLRLPMDAGWFLFFAWWAIVPYYLFRTQKWRALIPIAAFAMLWTIAYLIASLTWRAAT